MLHTLPNPEWESSAPWLRHGGSFRRVRAIPGTARRPQPGVASPAQAFLYHFDAQLRAGERVNAGKAYFAAAHIAIEIPDNDFVGRRARLALRAAERHAILFHLPECHAGRVQHAVRRYVG